MGLPGCSGLPYRESGGFLFLFFRCVRLASPVRGPGEDVQVGSVAPEVRGVDFLTADVIGWKWPEPARLRHDHRFGGIQRGVGGKTTGGGW